MGCEICGNGSCVKSFHSIEAQTEFDNVADLVKERLITGIVKKLDRLKGEFITGDDAYYIKLEDAIRIVEDM